MTSVELPRGVALNRFRVHCPGGHVLTRFPAPASREERRSTETQIGQPLFVSGISAYVPGEVEIPHGTTLTIGCANHGLHCFDLRDGLMRKATGLGLDIRDAFAHELQVEGFPGEKVINGIRVRRALSARFVAVTADDASESTLLVARHRTRWLVDGNLSDTKTALHAEGEAAERLQGNGPRRGRVLKALDSELILGTNEGEHSVPPDDYTIVASASFVHRHRGSDTFLQLQVEAGSLTASGKRNRYAVKDRYQACAESLAHIGWAFTLGSSLEATVEPAWSEVRIQACR